MKVAEEEVENIYAKSIDTMKNNIELYSLTKEIRDKFSKDEIIEIFDYMWQIILSDGIIDDFEAALMRNAAGLFHLSGKESAESKARASHIIKNLE